jgi:transcription elongation factor GreA
MVTTNTENMVSVGCWVEVQDGQLQEGWRIVPSEDSDAMRRWISEECPLAQALLGHRAGDQVRVQGPEGRFRVTILAVA